MENSLPERVAVLESKMDIVEYNQTLILKELKEINESLTKYKGFVGGVAFVATSIATFLSFAKDWVLAHLK